MSDLRDELAGSSSVTGGLLDRVLGAGLEFKELVVGVLSLAVGVGAFLAATVVVTGFAELVFSANGWDVGREARAGLVAELALGLGLEIWTAAAGFGGTDRGLANVN